ncbi:MAG: PAS domain-containing protein, partial [Syntrophomonadaceae bacterium]|nr:PAS domain-containing protein [Syntrophomonadaceae bacterium]
MCRSGLNLSNNYQEKYEAWQQYFEQGITPKNIRPVILESWNKAREIGVDPFSSIEEGIVLEEEMLSLKLEENRELIDMAIPFMQSIYDIVKGSGFVVMLTDENATILHIVGDEEILEQGKNVNLVQGGNWSYFTTGNCAIALCLELGKPVQVVASEHVKKSLHDWCCSASPIHNSEGRVIGVLNMSGDYRYTNPHTLGMVVAAANAIEKNLAEKTISNQLAANNKYLNTILDSMSDGLISIDANQNITMVNRIAKELLGLNADGDTEVRLPQKCLEILTEVLATGKAVEDEEVDYEAEHGRFYYTLTAKPIYGWESKVIGVVGLLREIKNVKKLVNKMAGATATFTFNDLIGTSRDFVDAILKSKIAAKSSSSVLLQ